MKQNGCTAHTRTRANQQDLCREIASCKCVKYRDIVGSPSVVTYGILYHPECVPPLSVLDGGAIMRS